LETAELHATHPPLTYMNTFGLIQLSLHRTIKLSLSIRLYLLLNYCNDQGKGGTDQAGTLKDGRVERVRTNRGRQWQVIRTARCGGFVSKGAKGPLVIERCFDSILVVRKRYTVWLPTARTQLPIEQKVDARSSRDIDDIIGTTVNANVIDLVRVGIDAAKK
jgi:hypothetical protein